MERESIQQLFHFIKNSPTAFHAIFEMKENLERAGYQELREKDNWSLTAGGKYYVTRNDSSIIAFHIGTGFSMNSGAPSNGYGFKIVASHSDSPAFKVKENAELEVRKKYVQLNTEGYGGMICSTWLDRPLSVAGRVIVRDGDHFQAKLVNIDRDLVLIPNLSIHINRKVNDGYAYNKQVDMVPLFGGSDVKKGDFQKLVAKEAGVEASSVYGSDLFLYNRQEPSVWGANEEFISAPRLDDLQCAYAALQGFLKADLSAGSSINVYACFDNEEVGSGTKQGAGSTFLYDVLRRINLGLHKSEEDYYRAIASSFMLSADNAHAVHPNHPEKTDLENCVYMNEGVVVKSHAGQKYTSDAVSIAIFKSLCETAGVPVQFFANRSDEAGGSTLGNISSGQVSLPAVDIGLPQLAMHSAYETAGVKDIEYMIRVIQVFFK